MRTTTLFILFSAALISCSEKKKGCTDARAINFDLHAKVDDGSCVLAIDPVPGKYFFDGQRFPASGGTGTIFRDSFTISFISGSNYNIQSLAWCSDIQVRLVGGVLLLVESNCGVTSWDSGIDTENSFFITLRKMEGTDEYIYSGDAIKLQE